MSTEPVRSGSEWIRALGQRIRVEYRRGWGPPLVLCNGIGGSLELFDPFVAALPRGIPVLRFDVPGVGESPNSPIPYGFPYLACVLGKVLTELGIQELDILGLSWGGALAQQFAFQNPRRCRRLVLVSTATGALMIPARPRVLMKMVTPRRFRDPEYGADIAAEIYGGSARSDSEPVATLFRRPSTPASRVGYAYQLTAGAVWTSMHALWAIRQSTLIVAGTDDPIVPEINAKIMHRLLPQSRLHLHPGGHIDIVTNASELAPVITAFLR